MSFGLPSNGKLADDTGTASPSFMSWLSIVHTTVVAMRQSGLTAQRPPAKILWIGRRYFDTDLGIPIWWNGSDWVDATGGVV